MKEGCILGKMNEINSILLKFIVKKIKDEQLPILYNHMPLFFILPEDGHGMLFNEIANIWQISKSSLSDIINKYEAQGLIKKSMCSEDKRSVYISLEPQALAIKEKLMDMETEFLEAMLHTFDDEKKEIFKGCIDGALMNIKEKL